MYACNYALLGIVLLLVTVLKCKYELMINFFGAMFTYHIFQFIFYLFFGLKTNSIPVAAEFSLYLPRQ